MAAPTGGGGEEVWDTGRVVAAWHVDTMGDAQSLMEKMPSVVLVSAT